MKVLYCKKSRQIKMIELNIHLVGRADGNIGIWVSTCLACPWCNSEAWSFDSPIGAICSQLHEHAPRCFTREVAISHLKISTECMVMNIHDKWEKWGWCRSSECSKPNSNETAVSILQEKAIEIVTDEWMQKEVEKLTNNLKLRGLW